MSSHEECLHDTTNSDCHVRAQSQSSPEYKYSSKLEKREDSRKRGLAIDDEEGYVVDFESVCEVADAFAVIMGVGDDDDLVAAVYQFG